MYSDSSFTEGLIAGQNSSRNNGDGFWGGDGVWGFLIIALLFGAWGGNGFGGFGGNSGTTSIDASLQRGFDTQSIIGKLDGISNGICDSTFALNNTVVNGFNGVQRDMCTGFANINAGINATQVAMMQGQNAIQSQLADCCCTTQRALERGFADTNYNMATQSCAIQTSIANSTRDIIDSQRDGTRAILDWLCAKETADLRAENQSLKLSASQSKQNEYLINTLRPCPVPSYTVCNPFTGTYGYSGYGNAYNNYGCGCNTCGC